MTDSYRIIEILRTLKECNEAGLEVGKVELLMLCNMTSNYAYNLGVLNTLIELGYVWKNNPGNPNDLYLSAKGREYERDSIPF